MTKSDRLVLRLTKTTWNKRSFSEDDGDDPSPSLFPIVDTNSNRAGGDFHSKVEDRSTACSCNRKFTGQIGSNANSSSYSSLKKCSKCSIAIIGNGHRPSRTAKVSPRDTSNGIDLSVRIISSAEENLAAANKRQRNSWPLHESDQLLSDLNVLSPRLSPALQPPCDSTVGQNLTCFTYSNLVAHLMSLRLEHVHRLIQPLLQKLMQHPRNYNNLFNQPVNFVQLDLPEYPLKIKEPMDLGTVKSRLQRGLYSTVDAVSKHILLVFQNAMLFNPATHDIHQIARTMADEFEDELKSAVEKYHRETEKKELHSCLSCGGSTCSFCGEKCLKFESPIMMCFGACGQRIKRNTTYYISKDGARSWCQKCYCGLPHTLSENYSTFPGAIMKADLLKRHMDEEVAEPWVQCDTCGDWVHQICALFDKRFLGPCSDEYNSTVEFECALCKINFAKHNLLSPTDSISHATSPEASAEVALVKSKVQIVSPYLSTSSYEMCDEEDDEIALCDRGPFPNDDTGSLYASASLNSSSSPCTSLSTFGNRTTCTDGDGDSGITTDSDLEVEYFPYQDSAASENPSLDLNSIESFRESSSFVCSERFGRQSSSASATVRFDISDCTTSESPHRIVDEDVEAGGWRARDLKRTKLGDFLEALVVSRLRETGFSDVADSVTVRVVSNHDQYTEVPQPIIDNLVTIDGKTVPLFLPYRQKCILLFQNIDGIDVCLFVLYAQEFNSSCPEPNKSRVYIAYLDSVEYFRPIEARTMVYHEIMIGYLKWAQARGFKHGHIWSCPPQRGDNFIFWCHPPHQRTPSRDRLCSWYSTMLKRATALGIVQDTSNIWNAFFSEYSRRDRDESAQRQASKNSFVSSNFSKRETSSELKQPPSAPICPPIFEGDLWVNECLRAHKAIKGRARGSDGGDKLANHRKARDILKGIMSRPLAYPFNQPVDPVALNIPTYFDVVNMPMDLKTVLEKLRTNRYETLLDYAKDVRLTFMNAMLFNPLGHCIHNSAKLLLDDFQHSLLDAVVERMGDISDVEGIDAWLSRCLLREPVQVAPAVGRGKSAHVLELVRNSVKSEVEFVSSSSSDILSTTNNLAENHEGREFERGGSVIVEQKMNVEFLVSDKIVGEPDCSSGSLSSRSNTSFDRQFIENSFPITSIQRSDSICSVETNDFDSREGEDDGNELNDWMQLRRPMSSRACMGPPPTVDSSAPDAIFSKPELGFRGAISLMTEISKNIQRLKEDLFVINFAPNTPPLDTDDSPLKKQRFADGLSVSAEQTTLSVAVTTNTVKQKGKGRPPSIIKQNTTFLFDRIAESCMSLLNSMDIKSDTTDPDDIIHSPFIDNRHTFMEMCQYKHFQFDSLRRAKHSSLLLLYHLHHPFAEHLRPICSECSTAIVEVRWHCDICHDFDICSACYTVSENELRHEHELTPARVTFV